MTNEDLINYLTETQSGLDKDQAFIFVEIFCEITPPSMEFDFEELSDPIIGLITIDHLNNRDVGFTMKPGNILLKWKTLFSVDLADIGMTASSGLDHNFLIPLAALLIGKKLYNLTKLELSQNHAVALMVMWQNKDQLDTITESDALKFVNDYNRLVSRNPVLAGDFAQVLENLSMLQCIEKLPGNLWWLKEEVEIKL